MADPSPLTSGAQPNEGIQQLGLAKASRVPPDDGGTGHHASS
jgi:hypothetical protein